MAMLTPVADFAKMRAALVAVTRQACGLGQNQVVMQNSNDPIAQRPVRPFAAIRIQTPAVAKGRGFWRHSGQYGDDIGQFDYYQQMSMTCAWDFFADSQDEAYALAAALQFGMEVEPIYATLKSAGMAVWMVNQVQDLTALLNTGFEARSNLTVQFGYMAHSQVDAGIIQTVSVQGAVDGGPNAVETIELTADL